MGTQMRKSAADSMGGEKRWPRLEGARILVVDDDAQAVRSLVRVLEQCGAEVESAMSLSAAQEALARSDRFDAAVVDFFLVGQEGKSLVGPLRQLLVGTLMISGVERAEVVSQAISAGAEDFLIKPFAVEDFLKAVSRTVEKTQEWRHKTAQVRLGVRPEAPERGRKTLDAQLDGVVDELAEESGLTDRERKVVRCVVDSLSNEQIAEQLGVSLSTVKYHDRRARLKLNIDTRDELRQAVLRMLRARGE